MEKHNPGRPKKFDKRFKYGPNCVVCGFACDSNRYYCNATCRQRAYRERRALRGISDENRNGNVLLSD